MFKFIHTADIHLDSPLRGLEAHDDAPVDEIRRATRRAFENLIDVAINYKVAFLIIAGDLYDGDWKDHNTGIFFATHMGRLDKAGIKVFIVLGNHDASSQITKNMPLPENVTVFSSRKSESIKLEDLNVIIHGQSYSSRAVSDNLASKYPQFESDFFNIGVLHTSLTGREGHENYAPCTLDDLVSKGYQYWALGHVHKRELVSKDPIALFPGNLQGRHINEAGSKGATLLTVEDDRIIENKELDLDVLCWFICQVDISDCDTNEAMYEKIRSAMEEKQNIAEGKTIAIRLQLLGNTPLHSALHAYSVTIIEEIRGIAASLSSVWLEKIEIKTSKNRKKVKLEDEDSPFAGLIKAIDTLNFEEIEFTSLIPDLAKLKTRLPAELHKEDLLLLAQKEELSELKDDVKELLKGRLAEKGGES